MAKSTKKQATLKGKPLNWLELVDYQNGAIVSREVLRKGTGNVTLFAFDADQELSEHTAPFDALVCVLDGQVEISISGKASALGAGQMIIMPANKPHALKALSQFKMMLIMIRSD
ncbi:MAG TPA: cupin domain-containing protein [Candidatus Brocadiia bacterium]|nr:cupin domain-containing protein [Candidatus Brocadiia bacterium]